MAKITDPDQLVVDTELVLNTAAKTIQLVATGNLVAKDGVTLQALYSKLIMLWETSAYNKYPFPMYVIDAKSGQFQFGTDGGTANGWAPLDNSTRQMLRDGGWTEFTSGGGTARIYCGIKALASGFPAGAQFYYQKESDGAPANFTYTDAPNEGIQVLGDASNGDFDTRTFFKIFCRNYNYTYDDASLTDVGEAGTGAWSVSLPVNVGSDLKIQANDAAMSGAPYDNIDIAFYSANQERTIGGTPYNFRIIIDGNNATAEQIYTKVQYLLRQNTDINTGGTAGTVTGQTCDSLCYFVGDTLKTTAGVYIDNFNSNDINRLAFLPYGQTPGNEVSFPYNAAGTLTFNSFLQTGNAGYYRMYFETLPGAGDDYGEAGAITVKDSSDVDIAGTINAASKSFTFAYTTNNQGTRTPNTDAAIVVVAGNKGYAKPVVAKYTIQKAVGQTIALVAEQDRAFLNE